MTAAHELLNGSAHSQPKNIKNLGRNAFTNATNGTRLDFISIHRKGSYRGAAGGGKSSNILEQERGFFKLVRSHTRYATTPFFNDEADPESGWAKELPWRAGTCKSSRTQQCDVGVNTGRG